MLTSLSQYLPEMPENPILRVGAGITAMAGVGWMVGLPLTGVAAGCLYTAGSILNEKNQFAVNPLYAAAGVAGVVATASFAGFSSAAVWTVGSLAAVAGGLCVGSEAISQTAQLMLPDMNTLQIFLGGTAGLDVGLVILDKLMSTHPSPWSQMINPTFLKSCAQYVAGGMASAKGTRMIYDYCNSSKKPPKNHDTDLDDSDYRDDSSDESYSSSSSDSDDGGFNRDADRSLFTDLPRKFIKTIYPAAKKDKAYEDKKVNSIPVSSVRNCESKTTRSGHKFG